MKQKLLLEMLLSVIQELRANKQWGTAHVYQSAYNSFSIFNKEIDISFSKLTPALLKDFEIYLFQKGGSRNTVSTYMKVLKATYNRAVDMGFAPYVPRLFKHVHTRVYAERKKALEASDMGNFLCNIKKDSDTSTLPAELQRVKLTFSLMFLLRGIPFVDLVHLRKTDIHGNVLRYRRRKTGRLLTVILTDEAMELIKKMVDKKNHLLIYFLFYPVRKVQRLLIMSIS